MSRSATDIFDLGTTFVPPAYGAEPFIGGFAAALALAEAASDGMAQRVLIGGAEDYWLDLIGEGEGIGRSPGEGNPSYRSRLRTSEDAVTVPALQAAVDGILSGTGLAGVVYEDSYAGPYCGLTDPSYTEYITDFFCGQAFLGALDVVTVVIDSTGMTDAIENAIIAALRRLRAHGTVCRIIRSDTLTILQGETWETA